MTLLGWYECTLRRVGTNRDVRAGGVLVHEPLERPAHQPAPVLVDVERYRLEPLRVHRGDDRLGGQDGDLVLGRPSTEEDPDSHPAHRLGVQPMTRTSGPSSMPNRSKTRFRISAIKASTSSALAPPRLR